MEIDGKVAVVTGGASGIGRATAEALAEAGAAVVIADIDDAGGRDTVEAIKAGGGAALFVLADVTDIDALRSVFEAAAVEFGGIDIVHNNAGMVGGEPPWPDTPPERLARCVALNLGATIVGTQLAVEHLRRRGGGVVVNTASIAAEVPMPDDPMYAATKAGVVSFTKSCARLAQTHGIRVNAVLPAMVDTPMLNRTGDGTKPAAWLEPMLEVMTLLSPREVADAILALIRDESAAGETRMVLPGP